MERRTDRGTTFKGKSIFSHETSMSQGRKTSMAQDNNTDGNVDVRGYGNVKVKQSVKHQ